MCLYAAAVLHWVLENNSPGPYHSIKNVDENLVELISGESEIKE